MVEKRKFVQDNICSLSDPVQEGLLKESLYQRNSDRDWRETDKSKKGSPPAVSCDVVQGEEGIPQGGISN